MSSSIFIFGAGGVAREVAWIIDDINKVEPKWDIKGFLVDGKCTTNYIDKIPVINGLNCLKDNQSPKVIIAVGSGAKRAEIASRILSINSETQFPNIIHPSVIKSNLVSFGVGNIIYPNCVITTNVVIGNYNQIHIASVLSHDSIVKDYVTILPGCNISGNVVLNEGCSLGVGSKIIQQKSVGRNSFIGAGAIVINSIPEGVLAVGIPAIIKKKY